MEEPPAAPPPRPSPVLLALGASPRGGMSATEAKKPSDGCLIVTWHWCRTRRALGTKSSQPLWLTQRFVLQLL